VAGIAGQLARMRENERRRAEGAGNLDNRNPADATGGNSRSNQGLGATSTRQATTNERLMGQGRESIVQGKLQQRSGGQYLYLQSRASAGSARVPYSSAYPQYRREAERSVQRSQVPPDMRSVVRRYFEAINPDGKK
jgi:hypothetical protein